MSNERIDYVVVINKQIKLSRKFQYIINFIKNLEKQGLKLQVKHANEGNNVFITIHLSDQAIQYFSYMYDIIVEDGGHTALPSSGINLLEMKCFQTALSGKDLFEREGRATNKERILITQKIIESVTFGTDENESGINKLINYGIAKHAYPLHDGDIYVRNQDGGYPIPENDRQLLLKYWANFSLWYKQQPLNLIEKYFGTEVAFYFAWLGFYNKMLIPAAAVGLICSIISIIHLLLVDHERIDDICTSDLILCPLCQSGKYCKYRPLRDYCDYAKASIAFDNHATVFFAVFMSFWATLFLNLWARFENTLKIRWNVDFEEVDTKYRLGYKESCRHKRWSALTGKLVPYVPAGWRALYLTLSLATCLFLVAIVFSFVFGVIMYRVTVSTIIRMTGSETLEIHSQFLLEATSACLQVVPIKIFGIFYASLSEWLTNLENPRTQTEYDNSVIHKRYFLGFSNNYASLFYTAFLKGRFYSPNRQVSVTGAETDLCPPTGCLMPLCIQLCVLMLLKSLVGNFFTLIISKITNRFQKTKIENPDVAQWEKEYTLIPSDYYLLTTEFMEMIVQYGFVTFFVAAFPLAPLCALINNCLELRLDAYKLVTRYRRLVPKQISGIGGAWNGILKIITHLSIATNAFVLAFTSDFVVREIYKYNHDNSLDGYIDSTLSLYDLRDYEGAITGEIAVNPINNSTLCYYFAARHPPTHPKKYTLTPNYWYMTGMRLLCVIVFEHVVLLTNGILSYFISDVPQSVRETLHHNRNMELEMKLKAQNENSRRIRRRKRNLNLDQTSI